MLSIPRNHYRVQKGGLMEGKVIPIRSGEDGGRSGSMSRTARAHRTPEYSLPGNLAIGARDT